MYQKLDTFFTALYTIVDDMTKRNVAKLLSTFSRRISLLLYANAASPAISRKTETHMRLLCGPVIAGR